MNLTADESALIGYLNQWCPGADVSGAISIRVGWDPAAKDAHTESLQKSFSGDWDRLASAARSLRDKGVIGLRDSKTVWKLWPTEAGRRLTEPAGDGESRGNGARNPTPPGAIWERIAAVCAALVVLCLVMYLAVRNEPIYDQNIAVMVRIILSLAVAVLAATVPGFLLVEWKGAQGYLRAGGALAIFVLCYFGTPKVFPNVKPPPPTIRAGDGVDAGNLTIPVGRNVAVWVENAPPDASVTWSRPKRGTLNSTEGASVRYTAISAGDEALEVMVASPKGKAFHADMAFRVLATLENLSAVNSAGDGEEPRSPGAAVVVGGGVRNPLAEQVRLKNLVVHIDQAVADPTFVPAIEMFPFLDYLVVRPVDRGWGPARSGKLVLFDTEPTEKSPVPLPDFAKLLDVPAKEIALDAESWGRSFFLPLGQKGEPFALIASEWPANGGDGSERGWRPRQFTATPTAEMIQVSYQQFVEQQLGPEPGIMATAAGTILTGQQRIATGYRTRTFKPAPETSAEEWLARLVDARTTGAISEGFTIVTGDMGIRPVSQMRTVSTLFFGAEIHLRDGGYREFRVPIADNIAPGGEFKFNLVLNTTKSLSVSGQVLLEYQIGDGESSLHKAAQFDGTTNVPRADNARWDATAEFLKALRTFDPAVSQRAVQVLERFRAAGKAPTPLAARAQLIRQCQNAILILMTDPDASAHQTQVLDSLNSELGRAAIQDLFPLACCYFPDFAVQSAIQELKRMPGDDEGSLIAPDQLIASCLCRPETARLLPRHRDAVEQAMSKGMFDYPSARRVAVGILADLPESAWTERPNEPWTNEWAIVAWSLARKHNAHLESEVRRRLKDKTEDRLIAARIIDGLTLSADNRFRTEAAMLIEQTIDSSARSLGDYQALVAGLKYLALFPTSSGVRPLMSQLESYPYDALIRELAQRILSNPTTD